MSDRLEAGGQGLTPAVHEALEGIIGMAVAQEAVLKEGFSEAMAVTELGISRNPVRQAIALLSYNGLAQAVSGRGTRLVAPSHEEMKQLRWMIQPHERDAEGSIRLSDGLREDPLIGEAFEALETAAAVTTEGSDFIDGILKADSTFHQVVCSVGRQEAAASLIGPIGPMGLRRRIGQLLRPAMNEGTARRLVDADRRIFSGLQAGGPIVGQRPVDRYYELVSETE